MTVFEDRQNFIDRLVRQRDQRKSEARQILDRAKANGKSDLEAREQRHFKDAVTDTKALNERIETEREELQRMGVGNPELERLRGGLRTSSHSKATSADWARRAAHTITSSQTESRGITSGSFDIPVWSETEVASWGHPARLIDLVVNRKMVESNVYEFFKMTVRQNNAAPTPDLTDKPVSVFTTVPVTDRCRVVAHVSEQIPLRLLQDAEQLERFLAMEMVNGVWDSLEHQIVGGDGTGENMLGLIFQPGITNVAFAGDAPSSIRAALTQMQILGETVNGIALHPIDAARIDTLRWGSSGGLLTGGFENDHGNGFGSSDNFFGTSDIKRVISPSVPQGAAIVADWDQLRLYIRESLTVINDMWGDNFRKNAFTMRAEIRAGIGLLKPRAFALAALTNGGTTP